MKTHLFAIGNSTVNKFIENPDVGLREGDFIFGLFRGRYWGEMPFWKRWTIMRVVSGEAFNSTVQFLYPRKKSCWNCNIGETARIKILGIRNFQIFYCDDFWHHIWRDIKEDFKKDGLMRRSN